MSISTDVIVQLGFFFFFFLYCIDVIMGLQKK